MNLSALASQFRVSRTSRASADSPAAKGSWALYLHACIRLTPEEDQYQQRSRMIEGTIFNEVCSEEAKGSHLVKIGHPSRIVLVEADAKKVNKY